MQDERVQRRRLALAIALALLLHGAVAFGGLVRLFELGNFARRVQAGMQQRLHANIQVALQPEPEPEPPPPQEPPPEAPAEPAPKPPPKAPAARQPVPEPPAPAAAQAGRVLTAEPDPDEPVDLTGTTFVQGNADSYAGGVTASNGTATHAVRAPTARAEGVPGGTGTAPAGPDRSRPASVVERNWACPFPPEAAGVNLEKVNIVVVVSAQGKLRDVQVVGDPGNGFGREALRCAQRDKTYVPALDRNGTPVTGTFAIVVTFERR